MLNEQSLKEAYKLYVDVCKKDGTIFVSYEVYKHTVEKNCKEQFKSCR